MRIAVLGTGVAGRTVAAGLARLGHDVVVGTRDPAATRAREEWDQDLPVAEYAAVADDADLLVNATNGLASLAALEAVGAERLAGLVGLVLAIPLDFSGGLPAIRVAKGHDLPAGQDPAPVPAGPVEKALNTV